MKIICQEPYRLFFPLGVLFGAIGVGHWFYYGFGLSPTYSVFFHSSVQMLIFVNCFVVGFLMTFIPRFTGSRYASEAEVLSFLFLFVGMAIFLSLGQWSYAQGLYLVWLILLMRFPLVRLFKKDPNKKEKKAPPLELLWIPFGIFAGLFGTIVLMLAQARVLPVALAMVGKPMMEQGFLLSIVLGIAGFLIPRMLGTYQKESIQEKPSQEECLSGSKHDGKKISVQFAANLAAMAMVFVSFWFEGWGFLRLAYGLKAAAATMQFVRTRTLFVVPTKASLYVVWAWISAWMVVAGLWLACLFPDYYVVMLHITFIGGFTLMAYSVGTMVIMSHAGEMEALKKPLWIFWVVILGLGLTLTKRLIVIYFPNAYFKFLGIASAVWVLTSAVWLVFIIRYLFIIPRSDEFGRMHEQIKNKLN